MNNNLGSPYGATFCPQLVVVSAVTGAGTATFTATGPIVYCVNGKAKSQATLTLQAVGTTDAATGLPFPPLAANQGTIAVLALDFTGASKVCQGSIGSLDTSGNWVTYPEFPLVPTTMCPYAYIVCKNGATGGAWTLGTSFWSATGMTATPVPVMVLPGRPQVS